MPESRIGIRLVAILEGTKAAAVLLAGTGLLLLVHRDVQAIAEQFVAHLHLDPAKRYPRIFIQIATRTTPSGLRLMAFGAFLYCVLRTLEAIGLWRSRRWAEWLGVLSGAVYVPFEVVALVRHPGAEPLIALALNLAVVAYLWVQLRRDAAAILQAPV